MADPVVHITNGIPDSGTGNITTLGQTLTDGANASIGATTDAAVAAGAAGSMLAKLRSISRDLVANIVLAAGSNLIGKVGIDQTTPGTTNGVVNNAGQNNIGNVGGKTAQITVTPTVTASNAYGTNFVVGGLLTFANAFTSTGSGIIQSVKVNMKKVETSGFTLFLFDSNPSNTTWTDAAVANINAADVSKVKATIPLTASSLLGTHTALSADGLAIAINAGATTLYGILIANTALTNNFAATSDVTNVTIDVMQDC